jgi:hypothetical protein
VCTCPFALFLLQSPTHHTDHSCLCHHADMTKRQHDEESEEETELGSPTKRSRIMGQGKELIDQIIAELEKHKQLRADNAELQRAIHVLQQTTIKSILND